jgi:plasmid stabilization system protein ParE
MFKIDWTDPALDDLREIDAWLEREAGPEYSLRILTTIRFRAKFLKDFPRGGRPHRDDLRILKVFDTPYLIRYRILPETKAVQVLRVHHEREDWFFEP